MPEINNEAEKAYPTGELAALYGVSVRTVQYYEKRASCRHRGSPKAAGASTPKPTL